MRVVIDFSGFQVGKARLTRLHIRKSANILLLLLISDESRNYSLEFPNIIDKAFMLGNRQIFYDYYY